MRRNRIQPVVLGIDPSSKLLAVVATTPGLKPRIWLKHLPEADYDVRADWAERHMNNIVRTVAKGGPVYAFVELPVVGAGARATIAQAIVLGGTLVGLRRGGATEIHQVNNQRWKKVVIGSGAVKKPQIKRHVHSTWPVLWEMIPTCNCKNKCTCGSQDLYDAACINAYGDGVLNMQKRIEENKDTI